jgi:glycosyltransferase involved in cell wall biosynthesis
MKIACITTSQIPSSTANSIQVMKVCQSLAQAGGAVSLWAPGRTTHPWDSLGNRYGISTPFEVNWVPSVRHFKRYDFALRAVYQARRWGADLIYTWLAQSAVMALVQGFPVVLELHDKPTGKLGPWMFNRYIHQKGSKRLLVITGALQRYLEQQYQYTFPPSEIQVAPNGADLERYSELPGAAAARFQLGLPDAPTAVYTGHFYAGRGIDLLFALAQRLPQVSFVWVGGRPEDVAHWQACLDQAGVKNVLLTGFVENTRLPLYQAAGDVLLMPYERSIAGSSGGNSVDICSPMKMFEYMATGRAILASDLPVLHEVLNPGNAVFCAPEDIAAWEKSLSVLLSDASQRGQLAKHSLLDITNYTWRARAERALEGFGGRK